MWLGWVSQGSLGQIRRGLIWAGLVGTGSSGKDWLAMELFGVVGYGSQGEETFGLVGCDPVGRSLAVKARSGPGRSGLA